MLRDPIPLPAHWGQQTADAPADVETLVAETRAILENPLPPGGVELNGTTWKALDNAKGNHALLSIDHRGEHYVLKTFRPDRALRVRREWGGLCLLQERGLHFAPTPCYRSESPAPALLLMRHIPGEHLGEKHLSPTQLQALAARIRDLHAIAPETLSYPLWHSYADPTRFVQALQKELEPLRQLPTTPEHTETLRLLTTWLAGPDPQILATAPPALAFTRGDANLANNLWDGQELRILDFEGCGWRDPSIDLSFFVEHISSRRTPHEAWLSFVEGFNLSNAEHRRFRAAQRRMALSWLVRICTNPESIRSLGKAERLPLLLARAQQVCTP